MAATAFDAYGMLVALSRGGVRFVVIGGLAGQLHGSPSITTDLDICPASDRKNLDALAKVLQGLDARMRDLPTEMSFRLDGRALAAGDWFTFDTSLGKLDVLQRPAGDLGYEGLASTAVTYELDGLPIVVASLDDVIRMKEAAGRPKDRVELEVLGALRQERDRRGLD